MGAPTTGAKIKPARARVLRRRAAALEKDLQQAQARLASLHRAEDEAARAGDCEALAYFVPRVESTVNLIYKTRAALERINEVLAE